MLPSELRLVSLGNCFVHLPDKFVDKEHNLKPGSIISIKSIQNDIELLVMWNGSLSGNHAQLDLNFAQLNKLQDELVIISLPTDIETPNCSICRVELVQSSDFSILSEHLDANVLDRCKFVTKDLVIPIWLQEHVSVPVKVVDMQPNKNYGLLTSWTEVQFQHSLEKVPQSKQDEKTDDDNIPIIDAIPFVSCSLGIDYQPNLAFGSMLVHGERGSGKTHFVKSVINNYKKYHSDILDCKQLHGKRPENVKKRLSELLTVSLENQPSILVLEDIDSFTAKDTKHDDDQGQEVIYKRRLVDALCHLFKQLERSTDSHRQKVLIIATSRSLETLDEKIIKPKGRQYFNFVLKIDNPDLEKRIKILKNIIAEHKQLNSSLDESQFESIAKKCSSFNPSDLRRLVERAIIAACSRSLLDFSAEPLKLDPEDFIESLHQYVPANLRGVALQPKTTRTFAHVGGMAKIKEALMKTILLQIKHPKLFKKFPLRPQTSILLYGPPGCGKTLVAEALTNQECLNSICVRGPELLSKYIGASEAAVRNLFERAEMARPCVIFFDEFESLVAKRGADSTGVTDRIVNQFLTLMDGVERLSSDIFIVAATSRPDMIDPAILRPGRLDKHIYCPLPDESDRLDILKVLARNMTIEDFEMNISEWSHKLEGFTGADIQSFLYSAQLKALHDIIDNSGLLGDKSEADKNFVIQIKQGHLDKSFDEMKLDVAMRLPKLLNQYPATIRKQNARISMRATLA